MKKVLLATTMLAGTAGFASAEVSVTGYAEIGIWSYNHDAAGRTLGSAGYTGTTGSAQQQFQYKNGNYQGSSSATATGANGTTKSATTDTTYNKTSGGETTVETSGGKSKTVTLPPAGSQTQP